MPDATSLGLLGLLGTAAFLGFVHTLTGPDHYIPFIAMAKVGRWSLTRTLVVTTLCGLGHVLSSIVLGFIGIAAGLALAGLEWFEGLRGDFAAWLLLGFGLAYFVWGLRRAIRNRPHTHLHAHGDGTLHHHTHTHHDHHAHPHPHDVTAAAADVTPGAPTTDDRAATAAAMTPWILFTIFVFGPCEPLIPILMYPALKLNMVSVVLVASVFAFCTLGTMLTIVTTAYLGLVRLSSTSLERYSHALAGGALAACGATMIVGL